MKYIALLFITIPFFFSSCKEKTMDPKDTAPPNLSQTYQEAYRPQFHFSPPQKWMNDPNGLVYHNGTYHLFYQYYPEDIVWGPMHWGHAVSKDLIHWQHKPIALYPDEQGLIFSGSAVVDKANSSGFGSVENPPLVAIFTYHSIEGEKEGRTDYQTQGIAYSLDEGDTWTKYEGNPVIKNPGMKDFRDPKVFWDEEHHQWVLVLVAGDHAQFYRSVNLKDWELTGTFGKEQGAHGGVWECPDLFKMKVIETGEEKWVQLISINPGAPNGGSGTQYFVGNFDGKAFSTFQKETQWVDYGMDNYAGVTYNNVPNAERLFIGWMSNWNYARDTPTQVWRSAMTLPRDLSLHVEGGHYFLKSYPVSNFNEIIYNTEEKASVELPLSLERGNFNEADISFKVDLSKAFRVHFSNLDSEEITLDFVPSERQILFDRSRSGIVDFQDSFGKELQKQPYAPQDMEVEVRIILDKSSVEIFVDKGRYVFTNQLFPKKPYTHFDIQSTELSEIKSLIINSVKSIWNEK